MIKPNTFCFGGYAHKKETDFATVGLALDIDAGVTVIWQATLESGETNLTLVTVTGKGTFKVADGTVSATGDASPIVGDDGTIILPGFLSLFMKSRCDINRICKTLEYIFQRFFRTRTLFNGY